MNPREGGREDNVVKHVAGSPGIRGPGLSVALSEFVQASRLLQEVASTYRRAGLDQQFDVPPPY